MKNRQRMLSAVQIRGLQTPAEMEAFFRLNAEVFRPDEDVNVVSRQRHRFLMDDPDVHRYQFRGAFLGDTYVGGYALLERTMCLGPARLRTGCINGLASDLSHGLCINQDNSFRANSFQSSLLLSAQSSMGSRV